MDLQTYQRSLRRLVTSATLADDDPPYARSLVGSNGLAVLREVIEFWRAHGIEQFCVLSAGWLKRHGGFDAAVRRFVAAGEFSPDIAEAGRQFLQHLSDDDDALVRALARFELALHETRLDPSQFRTMDWPCDPGPVLAEILDGQAAPQPEPVPHRVTVSRSLPGGYECEPLRDSTSG
jgi:hypothetical protein